MTAALQQLTDSGSDGGNGGRFDGGVWHPPGIGAVTRIRAPPLQTGHPAAASRAAEANGSARQPQDGGLPSMCSMPPAPPPPTPQSAPLQLPADLVGFYRILHARAQPVTLLAACLCRVLKSTRRQHPMCKCPMPTLDVWRVQSHSMSWERTSSPRLCQVTAQRRRQRRPSRRVLSPSNGSQPAPSNPQPLNPPRRRQSTFLPLMQLLQRTSKRQPHSSGLSVESSRGTLALMPPQRSRMPCRQMHAKLLVSAAGSLVMSTGR